MCIPIIVQPAAKKNVGKKVAANPAAKKTIAKKGEKNPLFESRKKNFGIGGGQFHRKDLHRYVKWPKYVRLQRQRRVLLLRLKVPPAIAQFQRTADKNAATQLFKLLHKYRPETELAKGKRLHTIAAAKKEGKDNVAESKAPLAVKFGLNEIVRSIEKKKAKLVVIAHDVEPVELIVWLPALCRKMDVPYVVVKSKSRLGAVVHKKTATALALTDVSKEDKNELSTLSGLFQEQFNRNVETRRTWGGGILGPKSLAAQKKKEKAVAKEQAAKLNA